MYIALGFSFIYFLIVDMWIWGEQSINLYLQHLISISEEIFILMFVVNILFLIQKKIIRNISIIVVIMGYGLVFVIQVINLEMIGDYINLVTLNNANQIDVILNKTLILKTIFILSGFFIISVLVLKINLKNNKKILYRNASLLLLLFFSTFFINKLIPEENRFLPISRFYNIMHLYFANKDKKVMTLLPKDIIVAKEFNIDLNFNHKNPFQKQYLYKNNISFKKTNSTKPNVIIFFIESLSARLIGAYRDEMQDVTPNIDNYASYSMVVHGYFNHSTPTAPGLYGQNCSIYPLYTYKDMDANPNILAKANVKCMAEYASENNYDTYYFSHSRGCYTHFDQNFKLWGYNTVVLWRDFTKKFLHTDNLILGEAGPSDHQMMKGLVNFLKFRKDTKPFFLGLSTIESHVGRKTNPIDGIVYKDAKSETLNLIHNLDDAFGTFWKYFKKSKYFDNTIIILTGDHALYPSQDYKKVAGKDWIPSVYDDLSLIIYDPIHKLPKKYNVNATSVDLAPSVLQLLAIKKKNINSFIGVSIFDRIKYESSFGISGYKDFNVYLNKDNVVINKKPNRIDNKDMKESYESLLRILRYSQYLRMKQKDDNSSK